jgi:hypothetical protein
LVGLRSGAERGRREREGSERGEKTSLHWMDGRLGLDWLAPRSALEGWVMVGPCFAGERRNYCRLCSVVATVPENRTADCVLRPALAESAAVLIVIGSSTSSVHDNGGSKELVGRLFFFSCQLNRENVRSIAETNHRHLTYGRAAANRFSRRWLRSPPLPAHREVRGAPVRDWT